MTYEVDDTLKSLLTVEGLELEQTKGLEIRVAKSQDGKSPSFKAVAIQLAPDFVKIRHKGPRDWSKWPGVGSTVNLQIWWKKVKLFNFQVNIFKIHSVPTPGLELELTFNSDGAFTKYLAFLYKLIGTKSMRERMGHHSGEALSVSKVWNVGLNFIPKLFSDIWTGPKAGLLLIECARITGAEKARIYHLRSDQTMVIRQYHRDKEGIKTGVFKASPASIIWEVMGKGRPLNAVVFNDPFYNAINERFNTRSNSVLTIPLFDEARKSIGAVELIKDEKEKFDPKAGSLLSLAAILLSSGMENKLAKEMTLASHNIEENIGESRIREFVEESGHRPQFVVIKGHDGCGKAHLSGRLIQTIYSGLDFWGGHDASLSEDQEHLSLLLDHLDSTSEKELHNGLILIRNIHFLTIADLRKVAALAEKGTVFIATCKIDHSFQNLDRQSEKILKNAFEIVLRPLAERRKEIPSLIFHILKSECHKAGLPDFKITSDAMDYLAGPEMPWRGNIKELKEVIKRSILFGLGKNIIDLETLKLAPVFTHHRGDWDEMRKNIAEFQAGFGPKEWHVLVQYLIMEKEKDRGGDIAPTAKAIGVEDLKLLKREGLALLERLNSKKAAA